jgi:hypothetical protein
MDFRICLLASFSLAATGRVPSAESFLPVKGKLPEPLAGLVANGREDVFLRAGPFFQDTAAEVAGLVEGGRKIAGDCIVGYN